MHLEAKDLVKTFKRRSVVDHVSLRVDTGEIVGLLGPNGAGKTTTFYMITGLERPTSGDVFVSDVRITSMPMYARARLGISYLAQEASIFRKMTVEENLLSILEMTKLSVQERREKMENLLAEFRISRLQASTPSPSPTYRRSSRICASEVSASSSPTTTCVRRCTSSIEPTS